MAGKNKSLGKTVLHNLGKKWFQVLLSMVLFVVAVQIYARVFRPPGVTASGEKPKAGSAQEKEGKAKFKFLHCDSCKFEMPYSEDRDGGKCPRCQPPKAGYFIPTVNSVKTGGDGHQWRWYNIAVMVTSVVWLGAIVFILSRKVEPPPTSYVLKCVHCGLELRYSPQGVDMFAVCPGCAQVIKLPTEEEAMTMADVEQSKIMSHIEQMEENLRQTGTIRDPAAPQPETPEVDGGAKP